jgi:malonate decarboxylase beta subunit
MLSPHLELLDMPRSFDDGVIIGSGLLKDTPVFIASQEGGFMGGAVGEVHGAKIVGLLQRAQLQKPKAVLLLLDSGGVRLHEANAGLIAVSEIMRAVFATRKLNIPIVAVIGGSKGCFGGMGIVASCVDSVIMSEAGRLSVSGPEVIETANGVEEYDARDLGLVWRTTGAKHRYILGDCDYLVEDNFNAYRKTIIKAIHSYHTLSDPLAALEAEHHLLQVRLQLFSQYKDAFEIWSAKGFKKPEDIPLMTLNTFLETTKNLGNRMDTHDA